jgi:hypothetical protein
MSKQATQCAPTTPRSKEAASMNASHYQGPRDVQRSFRSTTTSSQGRKSIAVNQGGGDDAVNDTKVKVSRHWRELGHR